MPSGHVKHPMMYAFRTCEASDDETFRIREVSEEGYGVTSILDEAKAYKYNDETFRTCEVSEEGNRVTSMKNGFCDCFNVNVWPTILIEIVEQVISMPVYKMAKHKFKFNLLIRPDKKNATLLINKYGGSLSDAINANKDSILG